ncbi:efflux RND transporter periplasmic adaptor subunit [Vibrio sp. 10N.261.45.A4]|uniref:efflux RND transporter periplasmic adaptor subunit n=1 Tax=Vibrio sp. 10N.261.45.A4 TaxID=3229655 RepID=UPI00354C34B4
MNTVKVATIALLVGGALGFGVNHFLINPAHDMSAMATSTDAEVSKQTKDEPLYWVAPMDPNYQRDKPGQSPMGMDLIPVYADDVNGGAKDKPGTVFIDSSVENNLGVKTAKVKFEALSPRIETVGYVAFDESTLWQTNVRAAGWVEKLYINAVGEKVNKGDVLFTLYSPELVKAQEELISAYKTGRKGLIKGSTERLITLGVDKTQIRAITRKGKASQTIEIKAPADGVIASLNIREGGYLSPAQAVISAGPLGEVWVDAEVFERQAHWISSGSNAVMTLDAIPGKEWLGNVDYVYPILDPKTRTLRVRLKFSNPNGELKPNMFANIALKPISDEAVLTIPRSSVIHSGGMTRVVMSEGSGKYRSARIEVGREAGEKIEVLQGLEQGENIVTSAHFMLDSESSQSADLSRINSVEEEAETVWANGEISDVMQGCRMVMNFTFAEGLDMSDVQRGKAIDFEMRKTESGRYEVVDYKVNKHKIAGEVWVTGDITMLMADFGMITVKHQPVPEWNWKAGEMNFQASDDLDLSEFAEGQTIRFLVAKQGSDYVLKSLEPTNSTGEGEL